MKFSILIPTYNGLAYIEPLFRALRTQTVKPDQVIIVDSSSQDGTVSAILAHQDAFKIDVKIIPSSEFNHGGTRNFAASFTDSDILVFLTQDAIPVGPNSIKNLISRFSDPNVASVYGRQLPYPQHNEISKFLREFNYPPIDASRDLSNFREFGIKAFFNSNSFSSYRRSHFFESGTFPSDIIFGEDTILTKKLVESGHKIIYASDAAVTHSHDYTPWEDFKRYFDLGVCHALLFQTEDLNRGGDGLKYVLAQTRWLLGKRAYGLIPVSFIALFAKWIGYKSGRNYRRVPNWLRRIISMNPRYWKN